LCTICKSSVDTGFAKQMIPVLLILRYNGSLVTWAVVSLTAAKFKPLAFSVSGFALSYDANMVILIILYDLFLLPAQFCCMIIYIRKVESHVQIADRCAPWKIYNGAENRVLHSLQFKEVGVCRSVSLLLCLFSNKPSIVARVIVAAGTPLESRCLAMVGCLGCCRSMFIEPLSSSGRLLWFCYPGFQQTCHSMFRIR
jgi:hypothetical protein